MQATTAQQGTYTPHPYHITVAGLEYITMATSAFMAIADAMALHGAQTITARPLSLQGGAA